MKYLILFCAITSICYGAVINRPTELMEETLLMQETSFLALHDQQTGYVNLDVVIAQDDLATKTALTAGLDFIIARMVTAGKIPDNNYTLSTINSIAQQIVSATSVGYQFDVVVVNVGRKQSVDIAYTLTYNPQKKTTAVSSYKAVITTTIVTINNVKPSTTGWIDVPLTDVDSSPSLQDALNQAMQASIQSLIQSGKIPDGVYNPELASVQKQTVNGITFYRFTYVIYVQRTKITVGGGSAVNPATGEQTNEIPVVETVEPNQIPSGEDTDTDTADTDIDIDTNTGTDPCAGIYAFTGPCSGSNSETDTGDCPDTPWPYLV